MNMGRKSVAALIVRWALDEAERLGHDRRALGRDIGVQEQELADDHARIDGDKHVRLLQRMADWPCGFEAAQPGIASWLGPFPELAGVACNRPTLREALKCLVRHRELIGNVDWLLMEESGDVVAFDYVLEGERRSAHSAFGNFALIASLARLYDGAASIDEATFTGQPLGSARVLRDVLQAPSRFGEGRNRLLLRSAALDRPFGCFNPSLAEIHLRAAEATRQRIRTRDSFVHAVGAVLRDWLHDDAEFAGADLQGRLCERYGISRWTLRRRLEAEQTSFQDVLLKARMDAGQQLLRSTRLPVGEIAGRVGYASTSAFTRTFTRVCGMAPSRYRDANGAEPQRLS